MEKRENYTWQAENIIRKKQFVNKNSNLLEKIMEIGECYKEITSASVLMRIPIELVFETLSSEGEYEIDYYIPLKEERYNNDQTKLKRNYMELKNLTRFVTQSEDFRETYEIIYRYICSREFKVLPYIYHEFRAFKGEIYLNLYVKGDEYNANGRTI